MYLLHTQLCAWACYKTQCIHRHNVRSAFVLERIVDSSWVTDGSSPEGHNRAVGQLSHPREYVRCYRNHDGRVCSRHTARRSIRRECSDKCLRGRPYRERSEDIMLVNKCLRKDLLDGLLQESPEYLTKMKVLEKMHSSVVAEAHDSKLDNLIASDAIYTHVGRRSSQDM